MNKDSRKTELKLFAERNNWQFFPAAEISAAGIPADFEFHSGEKRRIEKIENLLIAENMRISRRLLEDRI